VAHLSERRSPKFEMAPRKCYGPKSAHLLSCRQTAPYSSEPFPRRGPGRVPTVASHACRVDDTLHTLSATISERRRWRHSVAFGGGIDCIQLRPRLSFALATRAMSQKIVPDDNQNRFHKIKSPLRQWFLKGPSVSHCALMHSLFPTMPRRLSMRRKSSLCLELIRK
jgi:hypothetical protein